MSLNEVFVRLMEDVDGIQDTINSHGSFCDCELCGIKRTINRIIDNPENQKYYWSIKNANSNPLRD
jgi:hypothetical protein